MSFRRSFSALAAALVLGAGASHAAVPQGAVATGRYRNLFREYLGKSDAEVTAHVNAAWHQLSAGDPDSERLLYRVPGDMAYVPDVANHDVRSEGMSYLMMIAVQLDQREAFDQVWRFAKHYMYHDAGPLRGYFAWHTGFDGRQLSPGPASDGEEWFTMALFFAAHRWGNRDGIFNYEAEAQALLHTMLHKHDEPGRGPITDMFDRTAQEVVFVPQGPGAHFTDPSYHLPAFYELWAQWASDPADRTFLVAVTRRSRELFHQAANPTTGLMPDYANFDGTPYRAPWPGHEDFRYDAWRTLAYPALDWAWWRQDPWQVEQSNRVLRFLASFGAALPDQFTVEGTPLSNDRNTPGMIAMAAVAALAADRTVGEPWVRRLWDLPVARGHFRYYDGLLTMLALLETSGTMRVYPPPAHP